MHTLRVMAIAFLLGVVLTATTDAQDSKLTSAQPEHEWLNRFVGEWKFEKKSVPIDGKSDLVGREEVSAKMIGSFFAVCDWKGDLYGTEFQAVQTFGYSVAKQQYFGTWIDSMLSHQWHFAGAAPKAADGTPAKVVVIAKGPGADDQPTEFRETYHFPSPSEILVVAEMKQGDEWIRFMTTELKRQQATEVGHGQNATPDQ